MKTREIKFKVWHKKDKKFWQGADLDEINLMGGIIDLTTNFRCQCGENNSDNFVLLQFTGLKDKNGREIYEGDILDHYGMPNDYPKYSVIFKDGCFRLKERGEWNYVDPDTLDYWAERDTIIGNVFENPKLLKGK
jgi:uncharacterized phage protein (TIGR01671 family)